MWGKASSVTLGADLLPVLVTLCARDFPETPAVVRPETRTSGSLETLTLLLKTFLVEVLSTVVDSARRAFLKRNHNS